MRAIIPLVLLLGCNPPSPTVVVMQPSQPPAPAPRRSTAAASIVLTGDVYRVNTRKVDPLIPDQPVAEGDEVALYIELDHDAYVYVLYVDARGEINDLFPPVGEAILPRGRQRLPPAKRWRLDAAKGMESFIVLAAAVPLDDSARRAHAAISRPATVGTTRPHAPTRRPVTKVMPHREQRMRETSDVMSDPGSRYPVEVGRETVAKPDESGVTTAVFTIRHL